MTDQSQHGEDVGPMEMLTLMGVAVVVVGSVLTVTTGRRVVGWLVDQGLLVAAGRGPLVEVPGCGGAGLDGSRLAILLAGVVFATVRCVAVMRRGVAARGGLR